jgi:hypothetical protein
MQVLYRDQIDGDVINRKYRLLKGQSGVHHEIELGWHEDIGPNDSDASVMHNKDHTNVIGSIDEFYKDSSADIILVEGAIDSKYALSKRVFVCRTDAFRAKRKGSTRESHG